MASRFERTRYGWPYLIFTWSFGLVTWVIVALLVGGEIFSFQQVTTKILLPAAVFLLLVMICVFLRYRPTRSSALSSEDALTLCVVLVFEPAVAVVIMGVAAILNTISQLANRTLRQQEFGPLYANLGEVLFQGGMMAFVTLTGSTVFKLFTGGEWHALTALEFRKAAGLLFVYASIVFIRWGILFIHAWSRGVPLVEYTRDSRELRSFVVFLTEVSNVLLGVVMAIVYQRDLAVFCLVSLVLVSTVALISRQAQILDNLKSSIVELKILTGVGRALSNSSQTRKELLKSLYTQGKELFGADSFAIYLYPETSEPNDQKVLSLAGMEYCVTARPARRQTDPGSSGAWRKLEEFTSGKWHLPEPESNEIPEENAIGLAEWCLNKGRSLRVEDVSQEASAYGYSWLTRQMPYRSWMGVPLETDSCSLGVISVASGNRAAFTEQHQELLRALGQQVVSALENARLFELATIDGLTGLLTPRYLRQKLAEEFARAKKTQKPLGVVMIDIDYFKKINDTYGHEVGNEVLRHLAALVRGRLRDTDIAARYGGEEFTVLLPNTPATPSMEVSERLRVAVEKSPAQTQAGPITITVSMGVATYPTLDVPDQDALMTAADKALYQSKQGGRNRVTEAKP